MTSRERWLAAVRLQPVDRLPFWPKLDAVYPKAQDAPFREMALDAVHGWIGSDKHTGIPGCTREVRTRTAVETRRDNGTMRTTYRAPHGEMTLICQFDPPSNSWHPVAFPVSSAEHVKWMTTVFDDVTVELDADELGKARSRAKEIGQDAITANGIGESPLMHWVEWIAGVMPPMCKPETIRRVCAWVKQYPMRSFAAVYSIVAQGLRRLRLFR